jgi:hypothetical protein
MKQCPCKIWKERKSNSATVWAPYPCARRQFCCPPYRDHHTCLCHRRLSNICFNDDANVHYVETDVDRIDLVEKRIIQALIGFSFTRLFQVSAYAYEHDPVCVVCDTVKKTLKIVRKAMK